MHLQNVREGGCDGGMGGLGHEPSILTYRVLPEAQTLTIRQGRPPAGCGGSIRREASCRSPFNNQDLTASLIFI